MREDHCFNFSFRIWEPSPILVFFCYYYYYLLLMPFGMRCDAMHHLGGRKITSLLVVGVSSRRLVVGST